MRDRVIPIPGQRPKEVLFANRVLLIEDRAVSGEREFGGPIL
jgi:hypothetical protein